MLKKLIPLMILTLAVFVPPTATATDNVDILKSGKLEPRSIGTLEFGPDNILFFADPQGAAVYAVELAAAEGKGPDQIGLIEDLDTKIAALLGTAPREVFVKDMAVRQPSGMIYLSVMRGNGEDARPALVSVTPDGELGLVSFDAVRHAKLDIANAPGEKEKLYSWNKRNMTVTDLEFIDGELYIAGLSNEEFASRLRRVAWPFNGEVASTGLEIFHGAHDTYETFAPIFSFIPYEIEGKKHLLAGYLCTPLVTFPLDEVKSKDKLRGKTIAELGWGNIPTDIVPFETEGVGYVLVINSRRGPMILKEKDIVAAQKREGITSDAGPRTGVEDYTVPLGPVGQAADYSDTSLVVLGRSMESGALYLRPVGKRHYTG